MALRILTMCLAISLLVSTGCRSRSNYQPTCAPAVVTATPVVPACPNGPPSAVLVTPPPGAIIR